MNWKLVLLLTVAGLPGVFAASWLALPLLVDARSTPVSLSTLQLASATQGAILVLLAAMLGTWLGSKIGVAAPAMSACIRKQGALDALRPQLLPGFFGGVIGAAIILAFYAFSPEPLAAVQNQVSIPLAVRLLYGGITEEILMRWGLLTLFVWAGWRLFQGGKDQPRDVLVWIAIILSALVFGLSHLPSLAGHIGSLSPYVVMYITLGNALFGVGAGFLFWRYGLEAAITAHLVAHVLAYWVRG